MTSTRTARRQAAGENFIRLPGSIRPFKHATALGQKIIAIVEKGLQPLERQQELEALPPLRSRGHGGRHRTKNRLVGSRQFQDRSRYDPLVEHIKHLQQPSGSMLMKQHRRSAPWWARGRPPAVPPLPPRPRGYDLNALVAAADKFRARPRKAAA